jgi:hypothetical protein
MKLKRWLALLSLRMGTSVSAFVVQSQSFSMAAKQPKSIRPSSVLNHSPETEVVPSLGVLDTILPHSPVFWSSAIMLSIVALLFTWEEAVKSTREKLPATLMPVVDSMLAEMSGLGFIGLFLGVVVTDGPLGGIVGHISERYLGNEEILLESFEFLHTAFFEVGVGFFLISGFTVAKVLNKISSLQDFSKVVFDTNEDGNVCLEELADVLDVDTILVDLDGDGNLSDEECSQALRQTPTPTLYEQLFITSEQVKAEALVVRERFLRTCPVSPDFRIETYFAQVFSHNLEEIVELSPLTWLPLIPALSLGRSVDLSRNVVSAASPNAYESSGFFIASPAFLGVSSAFAFVGLVWGIWNFYKLNAMKEMLVPALVRDSKTGCQATLLPPRYEDEELMKEFNSSPFIFGWIESFFGEPARNDQERLFGAAGAAGPELYRNSIKFHAWLIVSQIVFWGTQIVARDSSALIQGLQVGNPDMLVPELTLFSLYVGSAIGQLLLAPQTFLNYCLITSIEDLAQEEAIAKAVDELETRRSESRKAEDVDVPSGAVVSK